MVNFVSVLMELLKVWWEREEKDVVIEILSRKSRKVGKNGVVGVVGDVRV